MTSAAVLAKLNVKNCRFDVGSGGIPEFTQCDIAASLAGTPKLPELAIKLALVKYAGQKAELGRLFYWTRDAAVDLCIRHKWGNPKKGYLGGISMYAIWENVDPHFCPLCNGSGKVKDDRHRLPKCHACNGLGKILIAEEYRSEIAGIDPIEWLNVWRARADMLADHLGKMDRWAVSRVKMRLSEPE